MFAVKWYIKVRRAFSVKDTLPPFPGSAFQADVLDGLVTWKKPGSSTASSLRAVQIFLGIRPPPGFTVKNCSGKPPGLKNPCLITSPGNK
jgi:hypothetical protein